MGIAAGSPATRPRQPGGRGARRLAAPVCSPPAAGGSASPAHPGAHPALRQTLKSAPLAAILFDPRTGADPMATANPKQPGPKDFDLTAMQQHAGEAARLLKALANERRLQVLCLLAGGERSVCEINQMLDLSQSALSQHLAVLRDEGLVRTRREAQMIFYSLEPGPAARVMETLYGIYCG